MVRGLPLEEYIGFNLSFVLLLFGVAIVGGVIKLLMVVFFPKYSGLTKTDLLELEKRQRALEQDRAGNEPE